MAVSSSISFGRLHYVLTFLERLLQNFYLLSLLLYVSFCFYHHFINIDLCSSDFLKCLFFFVWKIVCWRVVKFLKMIGRFTSCEEKRIIIRKHIDSSKNKPVWIFAGCWCSPLKRDSDSQKQAHRTTRTLAGNLGDEKEWSSARHYPQRRFLFPRQTLPSQFRALHMEAS